jgi:UDP-N-acetylmuramoyl-L-alanyl-D-glutamate--2,6-diaminopimelate ligase
MTLRELLDAAGIAAPPGDRGRDDVPIAGLAYRSEGVTPGTLFFCVPGFVVDGHVFAPDAVRRGAAALVCERPLGTGVPEVVVPSVRAAMGPLAAAFHGRPTARLRVAGATGTNGKTTTAFLARHVLEAAGIRTGLLGTVHSVIGGRVEEVERTTPEAVDLQATFARMLEAGDRACVMEVSSHALDLNRVAGIEFACAVFTNLTQDHLDFHGTLEAYYAAKRNLFFPADCRPPTAAVVNIDDEWGRKLAAELTAAGHDGLVTFAVEREADYRARDVRYDSAGSSFGCATAAGAVEVRIPLPGLFNVYNSIAAIAAGGALRVPLDVAAAALQNATRVPGRFEPIEEGQGFGVLVDYAHTPDSLENVLASARELLDQAGGEGRLIVVFGAGGDRDREKRPLMGAAARRLADHTLVTSDNPRSEEPDAIIAAIVSGAEGAAPAGEGSALEVEGDRRAAIERAMEMARPGDIVLIAGKGHEQGQEFESGRKVPFDDRDVAREALRGLAAGSHASRPR